MSFIGLAIGLATFFIIGMFHPIVIKCEYHFGKRCWWAFMLAGILFLTCSIMATNVYHSILLGVVAFSCFWSIIEVFEQHERVRKGWFPMNPKRKEDYK